MNKKYTHNVELDSVEITEMTNEELALREAEISQWLIDKAAKEKEEAELRALKISAYQKLQLSEAEIEALFPTPKKLEPITISEA
jgi:hypothetical protein